MENHKFKPMTVAPLTCSICYRPKLDEYHLSFLEADDISHVKMPVNHGELKPATIVEGTSKLSLQLQNQHENSKQPDCYGHTCPTCQERWFHNYKCWPGTKENLFCPAHFGQIEVEINRDKNLKQIISESTTVCSGRKLAETRLDHESFLCLEFDKIENFEERQEAYIEHINKMRALVEQFCERISTTRVHKKKDAEKELSKLTPEEIEDFKHRAARQKKNSIEETKEKSKKEYEKSLKELIKIVGNEDAAKQQMKFIYEKQGKEIPEI